MTTADLDAFARRVLAFHAVRAPAIPAGRWTWPAVPNACVRFLHRP
jgi:hypothetical protein